MATNRGTVDRRGTRRDLWVVGGAVLLAVLVTFGLSVVRDSTPGVVSSEGGSTSTCTAPPGAGAAFSDFIPTEDDADFELVEVRLIGANNLELVEARAVAVPEERQERTPFGAAHWPLSRDGQWWWDEAGRQQGPLAGWIGVMLHVSRPDPTRAGTSDALEIDYTSRGRPGTLERAHALRVAEGC
ncbi:hypothetical protein [Janibacter indicus]|uniref:Uncharacterized protein n=1 Tax=Janibacter indicus TaxID=857417 RepID=A0A1W2CU81_9MICO|nr:hypothetical protein [Janibacter indicus]SMC88795.1 hypothetical protein SAMN06296429_112135 [Janibacter indicus]